MMDATGNQWQADLAYVAQHINSENRQRQATFVVNNPQQQFPKLLAGTFVSAKLQFELKRETFALPIKSLSADNKVWFVDDNNRLACFYGELLHQSEGMVYVSPITNNLANDACSANPVRYSQLNVLTSPSANPTLGQTVNPKFFKLGA